MCDTFVKFIPERGQSFFAKNSDRHPREPQFIEFSFAQNTDPELSLIEHRSHYIKRQLPTLRKALSKFSPRYSALVSRPAWIWGAEMGVNEHGVAIGNEAVFSKEPLEKKGLLGMDILRLALHYAANAQEALETIIQLIEEFGQGGNGVYRGRLYYHNSFLIKDFSQAFILETAGRYWAYKRIDSYASISNTYALEQDFDQSNAKVRNFKQEFELKLYNFFTKGAQRRQTTLSACRYIQNLEDVFDALRTHGTPDNRPRRGMSSVCMHAGLFIKSETTASMVVHYINDKFIIWATNSPHPCVSKFFPIVFEPQIVQKFNKAKTLELFLENRQLAKLKLKEKNYHEHQLLNQRFEKECAELILVNLQDKNQLINTIESCLPAKLNN